MNKVILMGRLTKAPEIRLMNGTEETKMIARYTLAVDRRGVKEGQQTADFVQCVAFGKAAEFADKYFVKGLKVLIEGHIQTGSYTNKDGVTVYTTDVIIENQEFAESKRDGQASYTTNPLAADEGLMNVPEGVEEDLPFAQPSR